MRSNKINFLLILCCFLFTATIINGQQKQISDDEYFAAARKADVITNDLSRREETKGEIFSDGKLTETQITIEEIIKPNKQRYVSTRKRGDKTEIFEIIKIENEYYRRDNNGSWKKQDKWTGPSGIRGIPVDSKSEFTVEEVKLNSENVKVYQWYSTHRGFKPSENAPLRYMKSSFWVGKDGKVLKRETSNGFVELKQVNFLETIVYQYNPKVKIKVPIVIEESK